MERKKRANDLFRPTTGVPLLVATKIANMVVVDIKRHYSVDVIPVGSIRRHDPFVKDIDFLVVIDNKQDIPTTLSAIKLSDKSPVQIIHTYTSGHRRRSVILKYNNTTYWSDFFLATKVELPFAMLHLTGNKTYNIRIRSHVKKRGWLLNQYGLFGMNGKRVRNTSNLKTEKDITDFIKVTYYEPKDRM